jgi:hypothetical protein
MTTPIQPLPTPPQPSDTPSDFNSKAFSLLGALPNFVTQANALGGEMTVLGANADADAQAAATSATAAGQSAAAAAGSANTAGDSAGQAAGSAGAANQSKLDAQASAAAAAQSAASVDTAYLRNRANHTGPLNWSWTTYGGTANAIALTPAYARAAYTVGDEFRFRATASNTGATTINVGGLGVKTAVTVTGAALPSGYIRTDVDTVCVYDGTNFVVQREVEKGSNANGSWIRYADGRLHCFVSQSVTPSFSAVGSGYYFTGPTFTLPAAYANNAFSVFYHPRDGQVGQRSSICTHANPSNGTTFSTFFAAFSNLNTSAMTCDFKTEGNWYV